MMELTVYYINAKENDFSLLPEGFFSIEEKAKIERCKNPSVKQERIASAYLKKTLIGDYEIDEKGKPHAKGIHFNVSHSKGHVVLVKATCPVGIDIEAIRHVDQDLILRTMNEEEKKQIQSDRDFTRLWTQKEAILKMEGTGITSFEQLQGLSIPDYRIQTTEKEKYIYTIAYGKLHCFGAEI